MSTDSLLCAKQNEKSEQRNGRTHEHQGDLFPGRFKRRLCVLKGD
jgi:hypothetical protein